jgi:hypothetical protein
MAEGFPFGRWKGQPIAAIPEPALRHYLEWGQLRIHTRALIEAELRHRALIEAELHRQKGMADPAAPSSPPPPRRRAARSQPSVTLGVDLDDGVGLCALDLIVAGTQALLAQDPSREPRIRAAATRLREALTAAARPTPPATADMPF